MPTYDYQHDGTEHEYLASTYTLLVYEQQFKSDMIKDVFGRIDLAKAVQNIDADGNITAMDYTMDNWSAYPHAFWAMLKTAEDIARHEGRKSEPVEASYVEWTRNHYEGIDLSELSQKVFDECNRGLFHSGAAASD